MNSSPSSEGYDDYRPEKDIVLFSEDVALNRLMKFYPLWETRKSVRSSGRESDNVDQLYTTSYRQSFKKEDNYRPPMYVYETAIDKLLSFDQGGNSGGHKSDFADRKIFLDSFKGSYESLTRRAIQGSKPRPSDFKPESWIDYAHAELKKKFTGNSSVSKAQMNILAKAKAYKSRKIIQNIIRDP